ncbi:hypothetical protein ES705_51071 [subsurface metagenome]
MATNGVDKPVLNVFRMFGMMEGNRVEISGDLAYDFIAVRDSSVRGEKPDINAMATVNDTMATVLLWNYHDLNTIAQPTYVNVNINNLKARSATLYHYRVDNENSNSYEVWKKMGSPQNPTTGQYKILERPFFT